MITENKKLIKEINTIIASSTKAMEITRQEIEKVDAKYKALADKEKADLEKLLKMQEGQISAYKSMVCFTDEPEKTANGVVKETEKEPVEEKVVDTIFPENNEEETSDDETSEDETAEPETASEPKPEVETSEWGASESQEINDDDDDWGDELEEWK